MSSLSFTEKNVNEKAYKGIDEHPFSHQIEQEYEHKHHPRHYCKSKRYGTDHFTETVCYCKSDKLQEIKGMGITFEILFLNASNRILLKRYKETRRNHPLSRDGRVEDGIAKEREEMKFLLKKATYVIDTSQLLIRELKEEIDRIYVDGEVSERFQIAVVSFGFKFGIPADVDLVFDVRFLPNPYYDLSLRPLTGNDRPIQDFVMKYQESREFLDKLYDMLEFLIPNYIREGKYNLVVGVGCTGGKHRSVTIANALAEELKKLPYSVKVEHRDITR